MRSTHTIELEPDEALEVAEGIKRCLDFPGAVGPVTIWVNNENLMIDRVFVNISRKDDDEQPG